jgi:hypothetical protein
MSGRFVSLVGAMSGRFVSLVGAMSGRFVGLVGAMSGRFVSLVRFVSMVGRVSVLEAALLSLVLALVTLLLRGCMRCDFAERHDERLHALRLRGAP